MEEAQKSMTILTTHNVYKKIYLTTKQPTGQWKFSTPVSKTEKSSKNTLSNDNFWGFIATMPKAQCAENMMPRHTVRARPTGFMENATAMLRCAKASRKASWSGRLVNV